MSSQHDQEIRNWLESILQTPLDPTPLPDLLKDGTILCTALNKIIPNSCTLQKSKMSFVQRENITSFLQAAKKLGVPDYELFETNDLFEGRNFRQVVICIYAINRHLRETEFKGPFIGPRMAKKSELRVKEGGDTHVSWMMGGSNNNSRELLFQGVGRQIVGIENYMKEKEEKK